MTLGELIPAFKALNDRGEWITDDQLIGHYTVLYFYPMDNTPGCTIEACGFRDKMQRLTGVTVIGVSPDSIDSHQRFIKKHQLNFNLIADTEYDLCNKFGIRKGWLGIERATFLIDPEGVILWVEKPVKVAGHVERVIEQINKAMPNAAD